MKSKDYNRMYWDEEAREWRYEEVEGEHSSQIVPVKQNKPVVKRGKLSPEVTRALEYEPDKSLLETKVSGWRFRSKAKTLDKNLKLATDVANQQRELVEAATRLEKAKLESQKVFEEDEAAVLQTELRHKKIELEHQKVETGLMEEKKRQVELLKEIKELQRTEQPSQADEVSESDDELDKWEQEKQRVLAELNQQVEILEHTIEIRPRLELKVREAYPDRTEGEIDELVDRLVDKMLTEMKIMPE